MIKKFGNVALMILIAAIVFGCGLSGDPQRMIAKAKEHREKSNYKTAIIELKNVLQKNTDNAEARYLLGVTYFDSSDFRLAEQELRRALDLSYERSKVLPVLGKSMLMLGEFQKVLDQIPVEGHASNNTQAEVLTLRARALMGLGRANQAQELLNAALAKQPDFADALVEQGRFAAQEKKLEDAARLIERAIAREPKHIEAWLLKSDVARLRGDQAGALAASQKVLEIAPSNLAARLQMASLYIATNKLDEARKVIAQMRSLDPGNTMAAHMQALVAYRLRDYKTANDEILQVLKGAPDHLPSVLLAGAILFELGSHEQAQVHLARVVQIDPRNMFAQKLFALTLARSGQMPRAIEILQAGLKHAPEDPGLLTVAGELFLQNGEYGKAAKFFESASKNDPKNAAVRANLGLSRMAAGDTALAFADMESAAGMDTTQYQTDMLLIASHLERGSIDQALKATESLEKKQPNNPLTYFIKATAYLKNKDIVNGRKNLERALQLQPTFWQASTTLVELDIQEKNPKGARQRLESLLQKDKNNLPVLLALAELGQTIGATQKERVDWLERAIKSNPRIPEPRLMLSRLYAQSGDAVKALEVAQQALSSSPGNPFALQLVGTLQQRSGQTNQAVITFTELVKLQPKSSSALYQLASAQATNNNEADAIASLQQALSYKPDFVEAQEALVGLHLGAKRFADAKNVVLRIQKENPKSAVGFALEGDLSMVEGNFPKAIKAYETSYGIANTPNLLIKLHRAYEAAGKLEEGDVRIEQRLKSNPDDSVTRYFAADGAFRRGNYKRAVQHYEWLAQNHKGDAGVLSNLALAYHKAQDARALQTAEDAVKLAPDNASVLVALGRILVEQGEAKRGVDAMERAVKAAPKNPGYGYYLALGWIKAGEKNKARAELERVLATKIKFPEQVDAQKLLKQLGG